jgi:hypothetical protein
MNGQTGKFVGDLPMDLKAFRIWWLIWTAILSGGCGLIMMLLRSMGIL